MWHRGLGHIGGKGLQTLARAGVLPEIQGRVLSDCTHRVVGKQHRVTFHSSSKKKTDLLEQVYSDVCGPMREKTLGGASYFVKFIDDASRKVWVFVLKSKDQVAAFFKTFSQTCGEGDRKEVEMHSHR